MKIERLILKGYKCLMLNNIVEFEYTPESPYQLILGTNGSGKSSVLAELSPLPANPNNYVKDGLKKIEITHRGQRYVLTSQFRPANRHSFLVYSIDQDTETSIGEEKNPGGTITVQKELVRATFGLDDDLHELLIGRERFTEMPPSVRRQWITSLSSVDYTYAFSVYDRTRTQTRDAQGALKHLRGRLVQETQKLTELGDLSQVEIQSHALREELNTLFMGRIPNLEGIDKAKQCVEDMLREIERRGNEILTMKVNAPHGRQFDSIDHVHEHLVRLINETQTTQSLLDHYSTEYHELVEFVDQASDEDSAINVEESITSLTAKIAEIQTTIERFPQIDNPGDMRNDTNAAVNALAELFTQMPDNERRQFSRDVIARERSVIDDQRRRIDIATNKIAAIDKRLSHMREAKENQCPSCGYTWRPGYSEQEETQLMGWLDTHYADRKQAESVIENAQAYLENAEEYASQYRQFRMLNQNYPRLKVLWDYILENNCQINQPRTHIPALYQFQRDVDRHCEMSAMREDLVHFEKMKAGTHKEQQASTTHLKMRLSKLSGDIEVATKKLRQLTTETSQIKRYRDQMGKVIAEVGELSSTTKQLPGRIQGWIDNLRNQMIDQVVHEDQNTLAHLQNRLMQKNSLEGIVGDLSGSHQQLDDDFEAYKALIQALSPNEGLIADNLNGFIRCFTAQINSIVATNWSYEMSVLPCGLQSGDLDYKFPVLVRSESNITPDISVLSDGQKEIVNFSFVMTVMLYLGLEEYPLYLDELGRNFDEQHRINIMGFIKQLIDTGYHQQVFLISHYATQYAAFASAEVLVLDGRNIAVPKEHNTHVSFG